MNEEMVQQLMATAERLAVAAESLDRVLGRLDAQQEALNTKVDRIVAAVEERPSYEMAARGEGARHLQERMADLEKSNADLESAGGADGAEDAATDGFGDPGQELRRIRRARNWTRACWTRLCKA